MIAAAAFLMLLIAAEAAEQRSDPGIPPQNVTPAQPIRPGITVQEHDSDIYGYQLMTERERDAFRERLRSAESNEERSRVQLEHRKRMEARAKERGVTLTESKNGGGSIHWKGSATTQSK